MVVLIYKTKIKLLHVQLKEPLNSLQLHKLLVLLDINRVEMIILELLLQTPYHQILLDVIHVFKQLKLLMLINILHVP